MFSFLFWMMNYVRGNREKGSRILFLRGMARYFVIEKTVETKSLLDLKSHTGNYVSLSLNMQFKTETLFPEIILYITLAELLVKRSMVNYI